MAHACSPRAVTRAVQGRVRSIEHGNRIDEATARTMKRCGAYLVPTLSTYAALADEGARLGWRGIRWLMQGGRAVFDRLADD